jgi:hypothetical protein
VVPYSKWQSLTSSLLRFTVALRVAEVCVIADAGAVTVVGASTTVTMKEAIALFS